MTTSDHPFLTSLNDLSNEELDKKHTEILSRYRIARGQSMHPDILHQLDLMLNSIEEEKIKRHNIDDQPNGVVLDTDPIEIVKFNPNR